MRLSRSLLLLLLLLLTAGGALVQQPGTTASGAPAHPAPARKRHKPAKPHRRPAEHVETTLAPVDFAQPVRIVVLGLVKDASAVFGQRLEDTAMIGCSQGVRLTLRLLMSDGSSDEGATRRIASVFKAKVPTCDDGRTAIETFEIIDEPPRADFPPMFEKDIEYPDGTSGPLEDDRRLLNLRFLRERLRYHSAKLDADKDVVIIADYDLEGFPTVDSMRLTIQAVLDPARSGFHTVCGNGKMADAWAIKIHKKSPKSVVVLDTQTYDTFATIGLDGFYIPSHNYSQRGWARRKVTRDVTFHSEDIYPVSSCFGGLAVYHLPTYFAAGCDYESSEPRGGRSGHKYGFPKLSRLPCEHVVFHLCLNKTLPAFGIGISKHLKLYRHFVSHGTAPGIVVKKGKLSTVKRDKLQAGRTKSDVLTEAEEDTVRAELSQKYPGFKVQVEAANKMYGPS